jgi:cytochrome c5
MDAGTGRARVQAALNEAVARFRVGIASDPQRLYAVLADLAPPTSNDDRLALRLVVEAAGSGVVAELVQAGGALPGVAQGLATRCQVTVPDAAWAVGAWCRALGIGTDVATGSPPVGAHSGQVPDVGVVRPPLADAAGSGRAALLIAVSVAVVLVLLAAGLVWWLLRAGDDTSVADGGAGAPTTEEEAGGSSSGTSRPEDPVLARGLDVYQETCAACHGQRGRGGVGSNLQDVESRLSEEEHIEVVTQGRSSMPAFEGVLTPEEIDAVVRYEREEL